MALDDGMQSLGAGVNKANESEPRLKEGIVKEVSELTLSMDDSELLKLAEGWEKEWNGYKEKWEKRWKKNERYWLGKQFSDAEMKGNVPIDNAIFEAVETALPMATNRNPEPLVSSDQTPEGKALEKSVRGMLVHHADRLRLKKRLKKVTRHWMIYMVGAVKVGWSMKTNDISTPVIHPTKLILDPNGTIDDDMNYTGYYVGEWLEDTASNLVIRFKDKKEEITKEAKEKMGSPIKYIEYWTDEYMFWKMGKVVLGKAKNPHWNEDTIEPQTDQFGAVQMMPVKAKNHFLAKEKPYIFFSVFNLGKGPVDDTSLIEQTIPMQDVVNKRQKQIDKNVTEMNGSWVISMERSGLNKEQSAQAVEALRNGGALVVPQGAAQDAAHREGGTALPADVFKNLQDTRSEIQNLFGTSGSNPTGIKLDRTVNGKNIIKAQDESRLGTVIEALEQYSDKIFNWWVQLMYVHYDQEHSASIIGQDKAQEYITIKNDQFIRKLTVTVKEGSLKPRDPVSEGAEAVQLFEAGALDPITLYDKLGFANPTETAKKLWLWQNNPTQFFANDPKVQQTLDGQQQSADEADIKQAHVMDQEHQNDVELVAAQVAARQHTSAPNPMTSIHSDQTKSPKVKTK